ncbi:centrosomal protein of 95 kDa-like [Perca fluviatilis]|uniref:centrosomal protein of 95 kDa-like n=1 Tax=Perca fluviatilis TaxID=8168 RepID=UPI001966208B|nr:centrosomal protein of 95 kDa-like [Perca fluviatilis]
MWEQQMQQVDRLHAPSSPHGQRRSKLSSQVEEAQRKHDLLVEIIRKEQDHNRRLRDFKERIQQQKSTQNRLREQRQQIARAKKYHSDYHVQHRARLMRARTKEERWPSIWCLPNHRVTLNMTNLASLTRSSPWRTTTRTNFHY